MVGKFALSPTAAPPTHIVTDELERAAHRAAEQWERDLERLMLAATSHPEFCAAVEAIARYWRT